MEDRIKRMESVITTSVLNEAPTSLVEKEEESLHEGIESQAELSNHLANLVVDPEGSPNFIGWASGFSLLSPQGLRWMSEKIGDKDELGRLRSKMSRDDYGNWGRGDADVWCPKPRSRHFPLPSKDLASQYVDYYFKSFNTMFPVISRRLFNAYFERQYSPSPPVSNAWYALLNAVLCLGMSRFISEQDSNGRSTTLHDYTSATSPGVAYFHNASSCFHDLFFNEANLMAMQAVTLMLYITTSSPNPQLAYVLTSAAGNLANTLGLHRNFKGYGVAPEEAEQRRNVFWVFFVLEKAISHNIGRPSCIHDDDIAVDLPPKRPVSQTGGVKVYDMFQDQVKLAIIGSRICIELYSASSQTKSEADRLKVLGKLDTHLQKWRDALPIEIRPEHPIQCSAEQYVRVVMLHCTYLDAVILLHRLSSHQDSSKDTETTNRVKQSRLNPRVYASQLLCLAAARRTIQLLDTFNHDIIQDAHLMWMALYYPLSASLVLFTNILSNPSNPHAPSDLQTMSLVSTFIARYVLPGSSFSTTPTLALFGELHGMATRLVARSPAQSSLKKKRYPVTGDSTQPGFNAPPGLQAVPNSYEASHLIAQQQVSSAAQPSISPYQTTQQLTSTPSPAYTNPQILQAPQDTQSIPSTSSPHGSATYSNLDFAPFLPLEVDQFDYTPVFYDPLLLPADFGLDAAGAWMPSFGPDPWAWMEATGVSGMDGAGGGEDLNQDGMNGAGGNLYTN